MCSPSAGQSLGNAYPALAVGGLATSAIGAYASAQGARAQASIDDTNARLSELGYQAALLQGQHAEESSQLATASLKGSQRAAFASNGVDLGSDSAVRTLTSTDLLGEVDAQTIHANAVRAAFGYRVQEVSSLNAAAARRAISPFQTGYSTLLGGGAVVSREWYTLNKGSTATPPPTSDGPSYGYGGWGP